MSSQPQVVVADKPVPPSPDAKREAQARAAACRARLTLASDALAAADLLLRLNWSVGECGRGKR